ncbi:MAG TPA: hypothetical protein VM513_35490 [Kofleriaceae bacterium]|jgi:hypothetical protein|nr:hypothetical protein [Kofleriaceae bacterium]
MNQNTNETASQGMVSHAQNPSVLRRARDLYATYCASSDGKNYQGLPCPAWDALTPAVRGHWYTVALRTLQLEAAITDGAVRSDVGNERALLPNGYVLDHLADPAHALDVWSTYSGEA